MPEYLGSAVWTGLRLPGKWSRDWSWGWAWGWAWSRDWARSFDPHWVRLPEEQRDA